MTWATVPPATWPCGHDRSKANTQSIGGGGRTACRTCRRRIARESWRRCHWFKRPPLATAPDAG